MGPASNWIARLPAAWQGTIKVGVKMHAILFLAADPTDASRLRLGQELREIQEKLQLAKLRDLFSLNQRMSVRPADLSQALLDLKPEVVHFSGHGMSTGELCFEDETGKTHPIHPDALADLFEQFSGHIKCVLLNACYSEYQAKAIVKHIDYVVGMNKAIGDKAAIAFAIGFYQALGAGRAIEDAFKLGCAQIKLQGISENLTPVLVKKDNASVFQVSATDTSGKSEESETVLKPRKPSNVFLHRLKADAAQLESFTQQTPAIRIIETEGKPPTKYVFEFRLQGITGIDGNGKPIFTEKHIVEMIVHDDYPMSMPFVQFYTPIFHPNIWNGGKVCMGWFEIPYQLPDICVHLAKMIDYQIYYLSSPANYKAADWARMNPSLFPLTHWSLTGSPTSNDEPSITSLKVMDTKRETIKVDVVITRTGDRYTVEVPLDSLVRYTQDKLIEALKLPHKLENGWSIEYHLYNKSTRRVLDDGLTFRQNDVKDGDTLSFHMETAAG